MFFWMENADSADIYFVFNSVKYKKYLIVIFFCSVPKFQNKSSYRDFGLFPTQIFSSSWFEHKRRPQEFSVIKRNCLIHSWVKPATTRTPPEVPSFLWRSTDSLRVSASDRPSSFKPTWSPSEFPSLVVDYTIFTLFPSFSGWNLNKIRWSERRWGRGRLVGGGGPFKT